MSEHVYDDVKVPARLPPPTAPPAAGDLYGPIPNGMKLTSELWL
jgi:hypothetical protein